MIAHRQVEHLADVGVRQLKDEASFLRDPFDNTVTGCTATVTGFGTVSAANVTAYALSLTQ